MWRLAEIYFHQGRWNEAERLQVVNLAKRRRGQDYKKQDTLTAMAHLAKTYSRKGFFEHAEVLQRASSEDLEQRDTAGPGALGGSRESYKRSCKKMVESASLGREHPATLRAQAVLATIYRQRGRLQDAEALGKEVLRKQSATLGEEHPESLGTLASLGLTVYELGRLSEAHELQGRALQAWRRVLGEGHPDTKENAGELEETLRKLEKERK
ncbi:hypothetical protein C8R44DRAFT_943168 [Mycena epipterygia]|nr:hypothetical protein C8R44DRAFT_943168 [Mycena epipterygia]